MSNRDGKPELNRIEKMIEEESDPKQRAILVLLHYLVVSVTTSLDKVTSHTETLEEYGKLLNQTCGAGTVIKILFSVSHAIIFGLIVMAFTSVIEIRDTVTINSVRINALEKNTDGLADQLAKHNEGVINNQKKIMKNQ